MAQALVFPGQGAQSVGMGKELADAFTVAKEVFLEINDALKEGIFRADARGFRKIEAEPSVNAEASFPRIFAHRRREFTNSRFFVRDG